VTYILGIPTAASSRALTTYPDVLYSLLPAVVETPVVLEVAALAAVLETPVVLAVAAVAADAAVAEPPVVLAVVPVVAANGTPGIDFEPPSPLPQQ
jgi:hypothetical protein